MLARHDAAAGLGAFLPIVHVVLLEGAAGLKPRTPASRNASLTSGGAALSTNTHDQISVLSGPRGCHTRNVREVPRNTEKFGNTVPTIGLISAARGPSRWSTSGRISRS